MGIVASLLLLTTVGALVAYKASGSLKVLAKAQTEGTLHSKARWIETATLPAVVRPFVDSLNYLSWVMIALAFGVVIGAMTRAFVPASWLQRTVAVAGVRGQLVAALIGAPLMLCACCVAPVFEGVYERTRRLGPALGMMLAAPALNPAVLTVTFLLFPGSLAWTRFAVSIVLVLIGAALVGRTFHDVREPEACPIDTEQPSWSRLAREFGASLRRVAWQSLPAILVGILISVAIAGWLPMQSFASGGAGAVLTILLVAVISAPLALPTFGEIPLALGLLAAGAPPGAAVAVMIAGPATNVPSLLALGRATSWRVAATTGAAVLASAIGGGLLVHVFAD